ncbi:MAG: uracil-DNA glycosylase family protein, partial [Cyanobacteriota bacterium]|nr:uracil-DNA glycosylase family protein [Cyanobacteriota bacterium]
TLTADHLLLTQRGWIAAEHLQESDRVATGTPKRDRSPATAYFGNSAVSNGTGSTATLVPAPPLATDWKPLRKYALPPTSDASVVYCIDVEETANFVTPAGVVRNCRPPGNRTPSPKEIEACKPYLLEQIRLIDPQIILFTGATALRGLTGDKRGITKVRGQWIEWEKRLCMAIFHPAYLLRNPSRDQGSPKWLMWQDIQEVRAKLDQLRSSGS